MAKEVIRNASLFLHSTQLASNTNAIEFSASAEKVVSTNFASSGWEESLQGIRTTELSCDLMLESAIEPETTLSALVENATDVPFSVTKTYPPATEDVCWFSTVVALYITFKAVLGDLWRGSMKFGNRATAVRGFVVEYNADRTATGVSASCTMPAAASTDRVWIAVHVTAASGTLPTLDLVLESDALDTYGSPTTRITVPQFTAVGSYITYLAGAVTDTEYRISATVGGTLPHFTYMVAMGIAPAS